MSDTTKPIRIKADVHRKLKVYAAKAELSAVDIVSQATSNFMRDFSAEELREMPRKTKKSKP